jgi:ribosomal protein L17
MKQRLERVVSRMKTRSEQNTIYLKQYFPDRKTIDMLYDQVGKAIVNIDGGYVRIERINRRLRDGAMMARVEWAHAIVIDWDINKSKVESPKPNVTKSK